MFSISCVKQTYVLQIISVFGKSSLGYVYSKFQFCNFRSLLAKSFCAHFIGPKNGISYNFGDGINFLFDQQDNLEGISELISWVAIFPQFG